MKGKRFNFDWNQARAFLATAQEGSLSAAARVLQQQQPTLSRQVSSLEEDLEVTLFERVGRRLVLTASGLELLEHFEAMGVAAEMISLTASGQSQAIEGRVTIAATNVMATYHLPRIIKAIRQKEPRVKIDVVASNEISDLKRREADIAIRHMRPEQPDLIAKLLCEPKLQLYASPEYLEAQGFPELSADISRLDFIGVENPEWLFAALDNMGITITSDNIAITSESGTVYMALVQAGLGVGLFTKELASQPPRLRPVLSEAEGIPVPVWLVTHRELYTSRLIRLVFDELALHVPRVLMRLPDDNA
ncbi:MAG: LysR family transcriptional regulator [Nisaea sp.]